MKEKKPLLIVFTIMTAVIVGILTYINYSSGVPFYRHNETYRIVQSDSLESPINDSNRNYTIPFKKYSHISDEDLNVYYPKEINLDQSQSERLQPISEDIAP